MIVYDVKDSGKESLFQLLCSLMILNLLSDLLVIWNNLTQRNLFGNSSKILIGAIYIFKPATLRSALYRQISQFRCLLEKVDGVHLMLL